MIWNNLTNNQEIDLIPYIKDYLVKKPNTQIFIGTDSQVRGSKTKYAIVIALYNEKKGAHILYSRESIQKLDWFTRLMREVEKSIEIGIQLKEANINKIITIDLDLNKSDKYCSNKVLKAVLGWGESYGFQVRQKPDSFASSYAADQLVKSF